MTTRESKMMTEESVSERLWWGWREVQVGGGSPRFEATSEGCRVFVVIVGGHRSGVAVDLDEAEASKSA
eukprot:1882799-Rhodomonas_salina.4